MKDTCGIFNRTELNAAKKLLNEIIQKRKNLTSNEPYEGTYEAIEKAKVACVLIDVIFEWNFDGHQKGGFDSISYSIKLSELDSRAFSGAAQLANALTFNYPKSFYATDTHGSDSFDFTRRGVENLILLILNRCFNNLKRDFKRIFNSYSCVKSKNVEKLVKKILNEDDTLIISDTNTSYDDITAQNADFVNTKIDSDSSYSDSVSDTNTAQVQKVTDTSQADIDSDSNHTNAVINNDLISTADAAKILGVAQQSLAQWRKRTVFGVPFFTADEKHGDTWYYYRERVEQLKAVYQKSILQNMYRLSRKFEDASPSDYFQKPSFTNFTGQGEIYYDSFEVAEFLGVSESTLGRWRKSGKLREYLKDHLGMYWYAADRVFAFKSENQVQSSKSILTPVISDADVDEIKRLSNIRRKKLEIEINHFDLRKILPLDRQGKSFICPVCGNGSGHSGDGVSISEFEDDNDNPYFLYHCFKANDFDGRLTDILKKLNATYDWYKVLAIGKKILSATPIYKPSTQIEPATVYSQEQLSMIKADIKNFPQFLDDIPLADRRGLTIKTLQDFHIGFAKNWIHPKFRVKYEHYKGTPRLIIPNGDISYNAILINSARNADNLPYKSQNAGKKQPFNFDAVTTDQTNIIVEGEIDAMSIWQAGFKNVVALGGTAKNAKKHAQKFISRLNEKFPNIQPSQFSFLIIFDNDSTGTAGAKSFVETLKKNGYPAAFRFLSTGTEKVDANDILMNDGDASLKAILENIIADAQVELDTLRDNLSTKNIVPNKNIDPPPPKIDSNSNDELERIKALPPSKERDAQLIAAINDKLYLTPQRKRAHMQWIADSLQENADLIFSYDPVIDGLVGYDEFYRQYTFLKSAIWRKGDSTGDEWTDADDRELARYLQKTYQNFKGRELIDNNFTHYSRQNSFHPIKNYLESLKWDGVPRAETYFSKFLNIDDTPYTREITRKWLLGAISRIYHEGCDFQFALVLHGKQGIGKGYCLRMLGQKWHIVLTDSLDDSHALDSIERGWIVEIAELAAGRKAEINAQKVFLSENATTRRKAFARRAETTPRHCVFAISVNDEHFLRDLTGNRRYKIFESHSAQNEIVEGLTEEYVDQVWAEAFQMYQTLFKNGFNDQLLRLSRDVDLQADEIAEKHLQDDGLQGEIAAFLDKPILPDFIWRWLNKDERRKFFVDEHIKFDEHELNYRIRANIKSKNKAQEMINQIDSYLRDASNNVYTDTVQVLIAGQKSMRKQYTLYGNTTRNETCAAEIFSECFGNDKRKSPNRINEILSNLAEWKRVETQAKNFAGVYGNQKNSYRRDKNAEKPHHTSTFAARVSKIIDGSN